MASGGPATITVMASMAFKEAYLELVPAFERASGHTVTTLWTPSVQMTPRLKGGEIVDLAIMSANAIDELIRLGRLCERFDLARSGVGVAVRAGAPRPDLASAATLARALVAAESIACSHGPSGIYLAGLFERMGIAERIAGKLKHIVGEPVGAVVARGEAEIGFQQISELLPVKGVDLVGPLPPEIQQITVFSAGLHAAAPAPDAGRALAAFLRAPEAESVIRSKGMEPA